MITILLTIIGFEVGLIVGYCFGRRAEEKLLDESIEQTNKVLKLWEKRK